MCDNFTAVGFKRFPIVQKPPATVYTFVDKSPKLSTKLIEIAKVIHSRWFLRVDRLEDVGNILLGFSNRL